MPYLRCRSAFAQTRPIICRCIESVIVAIREVIFDLANRIERNADDDQQRRTTEIELDLEARDEDFGQNTNERNVYRTDDRHSAQCRIDIFRRRLSRTNSRDTRLILLEVIGDVDGIEDDSRIEEAEEDDETDIEQDMTPIAWDKRRLHALQPCLVGEHASYRRREHQDRTGKNWRNNACRIELERQIRSLVRERIASNHTLGMLDGDAALGFFEEADKCDCRSDDDCQQKHLIHRQADCSSRVAYRLFVERKERVWQSRNDTSKDDERDAVAYATVIDLLA